MSARSSDVEVPLVAVLGASGFIGSAVLAALCTRPVRVRAVGRRPSAPVAHGRAAVEHVDADLTDPGAVTAAVAGADTVIHLVGYATPTSRWRVSHDDEDAYRVNVTLVEEVVAAVAAGTGPGRRPLVVLAGAVPPRPDETDGESSSGTGSGEGARSYDAYALHKLRAERTVLDASRAGSIRGTCLRLSTVYGHTPGTAVRDQGVVATMVRHALADQPLTLWNGGAMERDLVHVRDVAEAFVAAHEHGDDLAGRAWSVGSGTTRPLRDICRDVADHCARVTQRAPVPLMSVPAPEYAASCDLQDVRVDPAPFTEVTAWRPRVAPDVGLPELVDALAGESGRTAPGTQMQRPEGTRNQ